LLSNDFLAFTDISIRRFLVPRNDKAEKTYRFAFCLILKVQSTKEFSVVIPRYEESALKFLPDLSRHYAKI